ncbi:helix-turn-helix domain-containing protein [Seonamhaeicola marinus]|uniref:Helix-turn-helix transcriptional regulator n=1 Tax=Seonamhaeicola marinus TaxID=1912246 RepID=A0A5D0IK92_9FLAO|nr:helix-turn-helix domain-containing protein [Seonamhaeicola marinus]TYA84205.1 helix-turn-helix transcriptional regulator [Seonamhaeicola marinus]
MAISGSPIKLNLLHIGYAKLDETWNYNNVISPFTRLFYVTTGNAKAYHSSMEFNLRPGYMYLIPSYTYNRYKCDEYHEQYYAGFFEETIEGLSIYNLQNFKYQTKASITDVHYFKRLLELNPDMAVTNSDPKAHVNKSLLYNLNKKDRIVNSSVYLETQGILSILLSRFITEDKSNQLKTSSRTNLEKVLIYIAENLHHELTVQNLANYCHLSTDHFSRIFQQNFGMRPLKYILTKRIERAQLLLLTTNDSLQKISEKTGFHNPSYFSRFFKKTTGKSPGKFRKEQLNL